jgi:hypothetical protein
MKIPVYLFILAFLIACNSGSETNNFKTDAQLSESEQFDLIYSIIRDLGKLPPKSDHQTKHFVEFDEYYRALASAHSLDFYHSAPDGETVYFLVSRNAPSLYKKRVAIGGKLKKDANGSITYYEEIFRTWKLSPEELEAKSAMLFRKMASNEDLSRYYPENSGDEEFIEFPNQHVHFDIEQRRWISSLLLDLKEFSDSQPINQ